MQGIAVINLGATKTGLILLWGLFLYDIFWVFGTSVMVTVATKIEGPIKLLFPSRATPPTFNMLGLGDIVLPGVFALVVLAVTIGICPRHDMQHACTQQSACGFK